MDVERVGDKRLATDGQAQDWNASRSIREAKPALCATPIPRFLTSVIRGRYQGQGRCPLPVGCGWIAHLQTPGGRYPALSTREMSGPYVPGCSSGISKAP